MSDPPLSESLATLSRFFVGDGTLQETLQRVAELTLEAVEPADMAGITLTVDGGKRTAVFTDEAAPEIDQAQYDTGDGPCLAAFEDQRVYVIDSMSEGDGGRPSVKRPRRTVSAARSRSRSSPTSSPRAL